ncbi:BlaI/MecI/CopY family transcriptional regulator [Hufsiella ginkgonis]|uniref:BlaI/MecI/CopY family transcriptional regulator n=1 Tax=Hufsiella ginkgonis TaxID=2695274 RepID=A0A7K1XWT4_9SPHI|nr:BlaI/MecI/CopY family transcriptional regulator [Hufsiella ginkgonis]MXV15441.1 BlaI/MecI/CopY family transcriptional regulator [Hufsiella ginkgonis]
MKPGRPKSDIQEPSRSELEILKVLWESGTATVRFVNDRLNEQKAGVQYTSTLKLMQIMLDKGLVTRDNSQMTHVYRAATAEHKTKKALLDRFVDTIYDGSASSLMMHLLGSTRPSKEELEKFKELVKKMES